MFFTPWIDPLGLAWSENRVDQSTRVRTKPPTQLDSLTLHRPLKAFRRGHQQRDIPGSGEYLVVVECVSSVAGVSFPSISLAPLDQRKGYSGEGNIPSDLMTMMGHGLARERAFRGADGGGGQGRISLSLRGCSFILSFVLSSSSLRSCHPRACEGFLCLSRVFFEREIHKPFL